jgi:hypothetical protein
MTLYWRDGLQVIGYLFSNPVFANSMEYTPYKLLDDKIQAFSEFMSGQVAWDYHVSFVSFTSLEGSALTAP